MALETIFTGLMAAYRSRGILIDTNLLLLLAVGRYDRRRIEVFKRTSVYSLSDFQRLGYIADQFASLWTTPNILTEVDNLGRQLPRREWQGFASSLRSLGVKLTEQYVNSNAVMSSPVFSRLGLADTASLSTQQRFLILSDDLQFYLQALNSGYDAVNFNHLRMQ